MRLQQPTIRDAIVAVSSILILAALIVAAVSAVRWAEARLTGILARESRRAGGNGNDGSQRNASGGTKDLSVWSQMKMCISQLNARGLP